MNNRYLWFMGLFVLVVLGVGYYLTHYSPTKQEKLGNDLQTYTDTSYGFTLRYPHSFALAPTSSSGFNEDTEKVLDVTNEKGELVGRLLIEDLAKHFGGEMTGREDYFALEKKTAKESKELIVNGEPALETITCGSAACSWGLEVVHAGNLYSFLSFANEDTLDADASSGDPIRATGYSLSFGP